MSEVPLYRAMMHPKGIRELEGKTHTGQRRHEQRGICVLFIMNKLAPRNASPPPPAPPRKRPCHAGLPVVRTVGLDI